MTAPPKETKDISNIDYLMFGIAVSAAPIIKRDWRPVPSTSSVSDSGRARACALTAAAAPVRIEVIRDASTIPLGSPVSPSTATRMPLNGGRPIFSLRGKVASSFAP